uniref:Flavonoid 3'5'-hydroxylase n=1 Tax=Osteospermum hybrid cultivar TaxID=352962 RepID=A0A0H4SJX6_9ASTR|nr:flavonoid 3'5'-hydroxylase [Osteospermum hybrid cultivar]
MAIIMTLLMDTCITGVVFYVLVNLRTRNPNPLPPGPTPWPIVGNLPHLGPLPHHTLAAFAKKYGPLIHLRFGFVDVVVASSPAVASQFLRDNDLNFASRPPNSGAKHMAYNYQDLVFAPYGPRWTMLRKICKDHLFSSKALDNFRHVREEEVAILTRILASAGESTVKLSQLLNVCTANTLARMMLDMRLFGDGNGSGDPKADEFKDMVVELMTLAGKFNIGDFIPMLDWMDLQGVTTKMKKVHDRFDSFLDNILDEHKIRKGAHDDMLSTLISLKEGEGGKLSDIEIKALLLNLFSAGTDTSSSSIEWTMAELIRNPQLLKQAQEEMDIVVGRDRLVTESDLTQLTFLHAIVKESFRLHPSTPLSLPRIASESCEVNGYHIPKGSTLLVNIWAIGRHPEVWADPLEFRPARFLPGGEKPGVNVKVNDFEVLPFGAGRRICAGMSLALKMVHLLIATLIQAFDWELANGLDPERLNMEEEFGISVQKAEPLMVPPRPRLAPPTYI